MGKVCALRRLRAGAIKISTHGAFDAAKEKAYATYAAKREIWCPFFKAISPSLPRKVTMRLLRQYSGITVYTTTRSQKSVIVE